MIFHNFLIHCNTDCLIHTENTHTHTQLFVHPGKHTEEEKLKIFFTKSQITQSVSNSCYNELNKMNYDNCNNNNNTMDSRTQLHTTKCVCVQECKKTTINSSSSNNNEDHNSFQKRLLFQCKELKCQGEGREINISKKYFYASVSLNAMMFSICLYSTFSIFATQLDW